MVQPATSPTTELAYRELGHWRELDQDDWTLLHLMHSYLQYLDEVEVLYRDSDFGPGWAGIVDADEAPIEALGWLAQFLGVTIPGGLTEAQQRQRIHETAGFRRGTLEAIRGAARVHLTGTQQVVVSERDTSPYHLTVSTYFAETPDPAVVEAALLEQKPGGLVLHYVLATGATYAQLNTGYGTYADMNVAFGDYEDQTLWIP